MGEIQNVLLSVSDQKMNLVLSKASKRNFLTELCIQMTAKSNPSMYLMELVLKGSGSGRKTMDFREHKPKNIRLQGKFDICRRSTQSGN